MVQINDLLVNNFLGLEALEGINSLEGSDSDHLFSLSIVSLAFEFNADTDWDGFLTVGPDASVKFLIDLDDLSSHDALASLDDFLDSALGVFLALGAVDELLKVDSGGNLLWSEFLLGEERHFRKGQARAKVRVDDH